MPDWNAGPYDQYQPDLEERYRSTPTRHAALGIISFVISIFTGTFLIALSGLAVVYAGGNARAPHAPMAVAVSLGICSTPVLALVGLGLGLGSLFQRGSKVFGILGIVFNAGLLFGTFLLLMTVLLLGPKLANPRPAAAEHRLLATARYISAQERPIPSFLNASLRSPGIES
jgi:hypothetical protein